MQPQSKYSRYEPLPSNPSYIQATAYVVFKAVQMPSSFLYYKFLNRANSEL
jgi:hypothetical protein